jgi:uncharacterized damage-inducible protein DinB
MTPLLQEEQRQALIAETRETDARLDTILSSLDDTRLTRNPPDGGWSVAQVLEHLCVADDSYLAVMRARIDDPSAPRASTDTTWKPSLLGGLLVNSFRSTRKLRAPRIYRVGPAVRQNVKAELMTRERELLSLLDRGASIDWRRVRMHSPVSSLIRLNLGDAFAILVSHTRRHLGQIERLVRQPGVASGE